MMQQTQYLVVTAIGTDRTGIISDLTRLVNDCSCNILDSRMAIFGLEFTFIMLLSGDRMAISKVENSLPSTSHELGLLTMMKRTSRHEVPADNQSYVIDYIGPDIPGTLSNVTQFLATKHISVSCLKADAYTDQSSNSINHKSSLT
ncbi:MAG: glycine cleavage system transcriptional repressor, partial [Alteromonadaceae bacterium]